MTAKLHINISQGVLDIEGDPELIREIYADFKDQLLTRATLVPPASPIGSALSGVADLGNDAVSKPKVRRRVAAKKKTNGEEFNSGVLADSPKTSGLGAFCGQYAPKNNGEKILIFLEFMTETLHIESPNTDQVYTCFKATGEKIPKAFGQAFYDMSSKQGYIDFRMSTDFPVTIAGHNHFNHALKKKASE